MRSLSSSSYTSVTETLDNVSSDTSSYHTPDIEPNLSDDTYLRINCKALVVGMFSGYFIRRHMLRLVYFNGLLFTIISFMRKTRYRNAWPNLRMYLTLEMWQEFRTHFTWQTSKGFWYGFIGGVLISFWSHFGMLCSSIQLYCRKISKNTWSYFIFLDYTYFLVYFCSSYMHFLC